MNKVFTLNYLKKGKVFLFSIFLLLSYIGSTYNLSNDECQSSTIPPPQCPCTPDFAGEDKVLCVYPNTGGVKIGCSLVTSDPACAGICYNWEPANGLNLGDLTNPNPNVNPTTTTTYEAHIIDRFTGNDLGNFEVTVFVVDAQMKMYKPKVIAGNTTTLATNQSIGAQTFENLDNDDEDTYFDNYPAEMNVLGGDDELVKLEIRLIPYPLPSNAIVKLKEKNNSTSIKIWRDEYKKSEYTLGTDLLLTAQGASLKSTLWVEGLEATTLIKPKVELEIYYKDEIVPCAKAFLTILRVERITWEGVDNSVNDDNILDEDPNFEEEAKAPGWPSGVRIFPDARLPDINVARQQAKLKVILATVPIEPCTLYVRSFDIDDPLNDIPINLDDPNSLIFLDHNDATDNPGFYQGTNNTLTFDSNNDNRTNGVKMGTLNGQDLSGIAPIIFTPSSRESEIVLNNLSMHPGDNYRIVVNGDKDFLENLRNQDRLDKHAIVDRNVNPLNNEIQMPLRYASPILTIWRFLNCEFDSMRNIEDLEKDASPIFSFSDFISPLNPQSTLNIRQLSYSNPPLTTYFAHSPGYVDINDWLIMTDQSPNNEQCNAPGSNGRFENGQVVLEQNPLIFPANNAPMIQSTGVQHLTFHQNNAMSITNTPCTLRSSVTNQVQIVNLVQVTRNEVGGVVSYTWTLNNLPNDPHFNLGDYNRIKIGSGGYSTITGMGVSSVTTSNIFILVRLYDDDARNDNNLLPSDGTIEGVKLTFRLTSILPKLIPNPANQDLIHNRDIPFDSNLNDQDNNIEFDYIINNYNYLNLNNLESNFYWGAYVCASWQHAPNFDFDPNIIGACALPFSEGIHLGYTFDGTTSFPLLQRVSNTDVVNGINMSFIYKETMRDQGIGGFLEGLTIAHEICHQFGLGHGDANTPGGQIPEFPNNMGIMSNPIQAINPGPLLIPRYQNLIRSRLTAPGR